MCFPPCFEFCLSDLTKRMTICMLATHIHTCINAGSESDPPPLPKKSDLPALTRQGVRAWACPSGNQPANCQQASQPYCPQSPG